MIIEALLVASLVGISMLLGFALGKIYDQIVKSIKKDR